jgi:hypothetical protein
MPHIEESALVFDGNVEPQFASVQRGTLQELPNCPSTAQWAGAEQAGDSPKNSLQRR